MATNREFIVKNGLIVNGDTSVTGNITSGTWNGSVISGTYGGTGVNNGTKTITLGGNISTANSVTTSGNFALTLTTTAATSVTLPTTGTLATLGNTETFSGAKTFSSSVTMSGTTSNYDLGTSQTTGTFTIGGTAQTGAITVGRSTGAQTVNIATGATTSGTTKTINVGTAGVSGSITNINIGSAVSGSTGNTVINSASVIVPGSMAVGANFLPSGGPILTLGTLAGGGSGYMNGTHTNQLLTGGTGVYMLATVTVSLGVVSGITMTWGGHRYSAGDTLTVGSLSTTLATTGASGDGTTATISFATQAAAPFEVGSQIIVAGITPTGYNGTFTVTACTTSSVSFANATTGAQTVAGTVKMGTPLTSSTIPVATIQPTDIYVSAYTSDSIGGRIRLESNDTSVVAGQEYGAVVFGGRDASANGSGDLGLIRGVAVNTSGGSEIQFWTAANAAAPTISATVTSAGNLRLYNSAGTFYSELSNAPTANRTITVPDVGGTMSIIQSAATAGYFDTSTTTPTGTTRLNYGGYFYPTFLNLTGSGETATAATHYFVETGSDGFVRPKTLANVRTEIVTTAAVNSAALTTTGTVTSGTWSASFGAVSGANLTNLTAANLTGTIPSTVIGNSMSALTIGSGLTGSVATYNGTAAVTISHGDTSTAANLTASGRRYVTGLTFDAYGHVTGYTTGTETVTDTDSYPTAFSWTDGTTNGPTGSLTGSGMTAVSFPAIPAANSSVSGIVTTGTQTITGQKTFENDVTLTGTWGAAYGASQLTLDAAVGNRIDFAAVGVSGPAFTTRSVGTKIVLYPAVSASASDYGFGVDTSTLWTSVPNTASQFVWYGGVTVAATLSGTGNFTATGNVTAYSDERLKSNIRTIDNAVLKVNKLRGVYFTKDDTESIGVIAQEVEKVIPEVVLDGEYKSVAYGNMVGLLIEAIKEQDKTINSLRDQVDILTGTVKALMEKQ